MTTAVRRPTPLSFKGQGVPSELKALPRWVAWHYGWDKIKWSKQPLTVANGRFAMTNAPATWCGYEEAVAALAGEPGWAGLGFVFDGSDDFIAIDIDKCFNHLDGFNPLAQSVLDEVDGYAEFSPSGTGVHIITRGTIPKSFKNDGLGLEIYNRGRYFTVTGHALIGRDNRIPTTGRDFSAFCAKHFGDSGASESADPDMRALADAKGPDPAWTLERVRDELLPHLDAAEMHHNTWIEIGQALHHQGEGDDEWCELWDEWSATDSARWAPGVCEDRWTSFGSHVPGRRDVKIASIIHHVKQARVAAKYDRQDHWSAQIDAATDRLQLLEDLPRQIGRDLLADEHVREHLAQHLKRRVKAVLGTAFPIGKVRQWLLPVAADGQPTFTPDWLKPYVYIADEEKFFDTARGQRLSHRAFDVTHNRDMPKNDRGNPLMNASTAAADLYGIRTVQSALYHPAMGQFFEFDGRACVNTYNTNQVPPMPPVLLDDEERAVMQVQLHIENILPEDRERHLFTCYLAYVVQNPGKKVRWAPYLCGVQGDGKTFFAELLSAVMGPRNVRSLSGDQLGNGSSFSDWATGQCVTVIDEVKLHGANRFDAANRIKPYITNEVIEVHPKGRASYNMPNTVQYLITSNFLDGMPATDEDRRFMFLQTRFSVDSLRRFVAADPKFYGRLFAAIRDYPGAIRYWLMHYTDWHPDFEPDGRAPVTKLRELVIDLSLSDADVACQEVWAEKPGGVTASWVAVGSFVSAVHEHLGRASSLSKASLRRICTDFLRANGFVHMGEFRPRVGPAGSQSRIWKHESVAMREGDAWKAEAELALKKSYDATSARDFLN